MVSITRILCPVDFSDASRHAADQAIALARWFKAPITALHVAGPVFAPVAGMPPVEVAASNADLKRFHDDISQWFSEARPAGVGVDVLIDSGVPARQILDRAARLPASLIVMGTHGISGFEHFILGSVTEKVLRKAPCPVLTVPPHAQATSQLPFRRILCAVDFSEPSTKALDFASSLAEQAGATLTTLHVVEWPWVERPSVDLNELPGKEAAALAEYRRYIEKSARNRLEALMRDRAGAEPRVAHGKPYVEILRVADEIRSDVIVIGVHGRNIADLTLFGSTTNHVVRRAKCPVLTLRQ
jgi:nucleotide-binding universal stress UspA family protein